MAANDPSFDLTPFREYEDVSLTDGFARDIVRFASKTVGAPPDEDITLVDDGSRLEDW